MNELENKILKEIKQKKPKPRWTFVLKNYLVWFFAILFLVFGSIAFTVLMITVLGSGVEHFHLMGNFWNFFFDFFPYYWLIFTLLFIIIGVFHFKHTQKGYKINTFSIVIIALLLVFSVNLVIYLFGNLNDIEKQIPLNLNQGRMFWNAPHEGRLAGVIIERQENILVLVDFKKEEWIVDYKNAKIDPEAKNEIRIIGKQIDNRKFKADFIFPLFKFQR